MLVYLCPSDKKYSCSWEGQSEDILHHFEEEHDELLHFNDTFNIDLSTTSENRLLFIDEEIYLAQTRILENVLEIRLRYLGPQQIAEKITYNILLKINSDFCHPSHVLVTQDGSIAADLQKLESEIGDITSLSCTLNINKYFVPETLEEEVFFSNEEIIREASQKHETNIESSLPHLPNRKLSLGEINFGNSRTTTTKTTEISLTRSKTINLEEIKRRNLKRAKSTVSLGAITEVDNDSNCTECGVILSPPIFLCPCQHSFCLKCQNVVCKMCSEKVTFERNISLEERFNKFLVPCRYKKNGCPEKLVYNELNEHVVNCTFCDYQCPIAGCHFEGQFKHVCKHMKIIHGATKILESFIIVFQNIPEAFLVNEEKGIFYCNVQYFDDSVKWEAKFCGPKERRFFCELKFKDGKLKQPVLLSRNENVYSIQMSLQELKKMKIKAKNAVLTIAC